MRALRSIGRHAAAAMLLLAPAVLSAQGPVSTGEVNDGVNDLRWDISVNPPSASAFFDAFLVTTRPGAWEANGADYMWIGATPTATLPNGGPGDGSARFAYTFRQVFTGGAVSEVTFRCAVDNSLRSITLNGVTVDASCGVFNFGGTNTLTGILAGANTLDFVVTGDGITDGLLVSIDQVTTTPEPSSLALLATGLFGIGVVVRRRRRA